MSVRTLSISLRFHSHFTCEEITVREILVIPTLGLPFPKDAPGHLDPLIRALLAGKIGDMSVAPKYEPASRNKPIYCVCETAFS